MRKFAMGLIVVLAVSLSVFYYYCTPNLTEQEIYTIINEITTDNKWPVLHACWQFEDIPVTGEYSKEFTLADIGFIEKQKILFRNLRIKPGNLKWVPADGSTPRYTTIDTICNTGILYHISFPLISKDRKKVLIEFREDCNCTLGGRGGKYLYEKKNGHWINTKGFDQWISKVLPTKKYSQPLLSYHQQFPNINYLSTY